MIEQEIKIPFPKIKLIFLFLISVIFCRIFIIMLNSKYPIFELFDFAKSHNYNKSDIVSILVVTIFFIFSLWCAVVFWKFLFFFNYALIINSQWIINNVNIFWFWELFIWQEIKGFSFMEFWRWSFGRSNKYRLLTIMIKNKNRYIKADYIKYDLNELHKLLETCLKESINTN